MAPLLSPSAWLNDGIADAEPEEEPAEPDEPIEPDEPDESIEPDDPDDDPAPDDDEPVDGEELGDDDEPAVPLESAATANPVNPENANTATREILRFITVSLVTLALFLANAMPENCIAFSQRSRSAVLPHSNAQRPMMKHRAH